MIKVIIGYRVGQGADIQPLLLQLLSNTMTYPGFVGAENLRSHGDSSVISMLQTWERLENWMAWEASELGQSLLREGRVPLVEGPRVTIYDVMPTAGWSDSRTS